MTSDPGSGKGNRVNELEAIDEKNLRWARPLPLSVGKFHDLFDLSYGADPVNWTDLIKILEG